MEGIIIRIITITTVIALFITMIFKSINESKEETTLTDLKHIELILMNLEPGSRTRLLIKDTLKDNKISLQEYKKIIRLFNNENNLKNKEEEFLIISNIKNNLN